MRLGAVSLLEQRQTLDVIATLRVMCGDYRCSQCKWCVKVQGGKSYFSLDGGVRYVAFLLV